MPVYGTHISLDVRSDGEKRACVAGDQKSGESHGKQLGKSGAVLTSQQRFAGHWNVRIQGNFYTSDLAVSLTYDNDMLYVPGLIVGIRALNKLAPEAARSTGELKYFSLRPGMSGAGTQNQTCEKQLAPDFLHHHSLPPGFAGARPRGGRINNKDLRETQ